MLRRQKHVLSQSTTLFACTLEDALTTAAASRVQITQTPTTLAAALLMLSLSGTMMPLALATSMIPGAHESFPMSASSKPTTEFAQPV